MTAPITVHGRLTRDPEVRFANSGTAIGSTSIAVNERVKDKDTGQYKDGDASFFNVVAFGQMAEMMAETLAKGDLVLASGVMKMRTYEKDGEKKTAWEITLDDIGKSLKWLNKDSKPKPSSSHGDESEPPF